MLWQQAQAPRSRPGSEGRQRKTRQSRRQQRPPSRPGGHALQKDDGLGAFARHGHGCDSGNAPGAPVFGSAVQRPFHFAAQAARMAPHPQHHVCHQRSGDQNQHCLENFLAPVRQAPQRSLHHCGERQRQGHARSHTRP